MKTINLSGSLRGGVGKSDANQLRAEGRVPCVLYGGTEQIHFWAYGYDLKAVLYTPDTYRVHLDIDGRKFEAIVHVDFFLLQAGKAIKLELPLEFVGVSPGVKAGGKFAARVRRVKVKGNPDHLPATVQVDISKLELGGVVRVKDIPTENYVILDAPNNPVASVIIPRGLKGQAAGA
jgi:large subunit ribosomal protein L25